MFCLGEASTNRQSVPVLLWQQFIRYCIDLISWGKVRAAHQFSVILNIWILPWVFMKPVENTKISWVWMSDFCFSDKMTTQSPFGYLWFSFIGLASGSDYHWRKSVFYYQSAYTCELSNEVWSRMTNSVDSRRDGHMVARRQASGRTSAGTTWHTELPRKWHIRSPTPPHHLTQRQWVWCFSHCYYDDTIST